VKIIALLVAMIMLSGCAWWRAHQPHPKSSSSAQQAPTRRTITTRGQKWMLTSIDLELQREKRGEHPPSSKKTWREYWEWRRSLWRKQSEAKQYDQYFARRRKELGLPRR
jgi:uncharacterized protein YceK